MNDDEARRLESRMNFVCSVIIHKDVQIAFDAETQFIFMLQGEDGHIRFPAKDCKMIWGLLARLDTDLSLLGIVS